MPPTYFGTKQAPTGWYSDDAHTLLPAGSYSIGSESQPVDNIYLSGDLLDSNGDPIGGTSLTGIANDADDNLVITAAMVPGALTTPIAVVSKFQSGGPADASEGVLFRVASSNFDSSSTPREVDLFKVDEYNLDVVVSVCDLRFKNLDTGVLYGYVRQGTDAFDNPQLYFVTPTHGVLRFGVGGTTSIFGSVRSFGENPTVDNLDLNYWTVWKNTATGAVKLWANDNGTLKSVTLS
jgi:hypothetical protein